MERRNIVKKNQLRKKGIRVISNRKDRGLLGNFVGVVWGVWVFFWGLGGFRGD